MMTRHLINGKPYTSKTLDDKKIIIEDWVLKKMPVAASVRCYEPVADGRYYSDFKDVNQQFRLIGTEKQLYAFFCKQLDEKGWQIQDSYDFKPESKDSEWYSKKENIWIRKKIKEYKKLYKERNKEVILLDIV